MLLAAWQSHITEAAVLTVLLWLGWPREVENGEMSVCSTSSKPSSLSIPFDSLETC